MSVEATRPAGDRGAVGAATADGERHAPAYVWCFLATIVFNIFSGHWDRLGVPLGLDRIAFAGGVVLLLLDPWAWQQRRLLLRPVHLAVAGLVAVATLSAASVGTLTSSYGLFALLDRIVVPFVVFCVAPVVFSTAARRALLLKTLVLLGLYLGVTAVLETLRLWSLVFPSYIGDSSVGIQFGRARGPFAASEAMGMACAACFFAAGLAVVRFRGAWRALSALVVALAGGGVLMSLTRSVWVGLVLGVLVVMVVDRRLRRFIPGALLAGAVLVVVLFATVPGLRSAVDERAGTTRSVLDRYNTNAAALRIVEHEPLTGVGWMKFLDESPQWVRQADDYPITNVAIEVHNVVLSRAAELGLPGAALFVACVLLGPWRAAVQRRFDDPELLEWRHVSTGMTAVWSVTLMLSPVPYPLPNTLTWLLAGIALTPYLSEGAGHERRRGSTAGRRGPAGA
ncbi:O-antigen ligase family protein [Kineococcus sp. SYSU DK004]|uniref:O-antigen ligase family protein n=1 Tax=Kineococcus sp. SYSU DK004 TaxID=3383125 RepID=UPI003D7DBF0C